MDNKEPIGEELQNIADISAKPEPEQGKEEGGKEALEKKRVLDLIKDKKRRQKVFLLEELMCLGIVFLGFVAARSWWPNDLALGMFGGVFIFTGIIMAVVFCGMNLVAMYAHRKAK